MAIVASVTLLTLTLFTSIGETCTRILWNDNGLAVVSARTMDWPISTEPVLTVLPRGMERNGGMVGSEQVVAENPAKWTSKYGSLVTTIYGVGSADGLNEKGLGIHLLFLKDTDYGVRDVSKPGVQATLWGQYVLDNAATVAEALELLNGVQIVMAQAHGFDATVHLAMEDASGDSAIIEYINGKPVVHHGRQFTIMTNDPTYDEQLALLKKQDFSKPTSETPLPGNVSAIDRFQRAAYFSQILPKPKNEREAVADVLAIARNVSVPFGAPYDAQFGVYNTEYRTVMDLSSLQYFFEMTNCPNVIWSDLTKFDLSVGAPVKTLNPENIDLSGNVTDKFQDAKAPF
ncbi:MAG: linear amide C-N hydrolase [Planctomycetota bacterium]|nr:linear amide C-N hydrolase [Planctomycetota bacterium]